MLKRTRIKRSLSDVFSDFWEDWGTYLLILFNAALYANIINTISTLVK